VKLWLSQPSPSTGKRHLVLDVEPAEDQHVYRIVRERIVGRQRRLRRTVYSDKVRYRFPRSYQEPLLLTFPTLVLSNGMQAAVHKAEEITYAPGEVPDIDIEGFYPERLPTGDLYDFQKIGIAELVENEWPLMDGLGLGKTIQVLGAMVELNTFPALVVCPYNAKRGWEFHINNYTDLTCQVVEGTPLQRTQQIQSEVNVLIVNFEQLRSHPELADYQWAGLVVDEFHRLKNPDSLVSKAFALIQADRCFPMSGTPIINCPEESWTILNRLWPDLYPNYWAFCQNLLIRSQGGKGLRTGYNWREMQRLKRFVQSHGIRRRKDQVLKYLPKEVPIVQMVELKPEQRKLYNQILHEGLLQLMDGSRVRVSEVRTLYLRLRQACFSPELFGGKPVSAKMEDLQATVAQLVANGEKALIGSQWATCARIMQRELAQYNPAYVDGSVKSSLRTQQEIMFNEDEECHLYIGTIRANRESINLGAATYVLLPDEDWSPQYTKQFIGRSAAGGLRGTGQSRVTIVRQFAGNTVERQVQEVLYAKGAVFDRVFEKDGGKREVRRVVDEIAQIFLSAAGSRTAA
jgi:SNF2 family DNA or RNA helicase